MNPIITLIRKDLTLFLKDKPTILLTFLVPLVIIYIVGNIFTGGGADAGPSGNIKLAAYSESGDATADAFIQALQAEETLKIITSPTRSTGEEQSAFTRDSLKAGIANHHYNYAIIIPQNYRKENGVGFNLEYFSNPKNQIESQIVNGLDTSFASPSTLRPLRTLKAVQKPQPLNTRKDAKKNPLNSDLPNAPFASFSVFRG